MIRQNLAYDIGGPIKGYIDYDDKQNHPKVLFEVVLKGNPLGAQAIRTYLTTVRLFEMGKSKPEGTDQYDEVRRAPTANIRYFEQALQELGSRFGIFLA
ncbi:MAG: hypothetical protein ACYTBJ_01005 [Planctomycetota bacterium]|jgi:hypothetical protein